MAGQLNIPAPSSCANFVLDLHGLNRAIQRGGPRNQVPGLSSWFSWQNNVTNRGIAATDTKLSVQKMLKGRRGANNEDIRFSSWWRPQTNGGSRVWILLDALTSSPRNAASISRLVGENTHILEQKQHQQGGKQWRHCCTQMSIVKFSAQTSSIAPLWMSNFTRLIQGLVWLRLVGRNFIALVSSSRVVLSWNLELRLLVFSSDRQQSRATKCLTLWRTNVQRLQCNV